MDLIHHLARAEDKMQHRLVQKGFSGLQIIVVEGKQTVFGVAPASTAISRGRFNYWKRSFIEFTSGLKEDWYTVPRTDHRVEELRRITSRDIGSRPGFFLFNSAGRILLSSGARHLALDKYAIGFPWFENNENPLAVQHLLEPLTMEDAVKSCRLVSLLMLHQSNDESKNVSSLCAVLDCYKSSVTALGGQFKVPPGDASFYYTTDRVVGLTSLLKIARAGGRPILLSEVRDALATVPDGGGVLINLWMPRQDKDATYAVALIPDKSAKILSSPHFFAHPSLPWMHTP